MSKLHVVTKGDTLSRIAKTYGVSVKDLIKINELPNPNKLQIGQRIILDKTQVLGFQLLVLDKDRNPIEGQGYRLEFAGKFVKGFTGKNGLTEQIITSDPQDQVRILIERLDKTLKEIGTVVSGYGNKLVTLISPKIMLQSSTEKHPNSDAKRSLGAQEKPKPIYDPAIKRPATDKKILGVVQTKTKTPDGKPLIKVNGDIPQLDFLIDPQNFQPLTDTDFEIAAESLKLSPSHIKTVIEVEARGRFFWKISNGTLRVLPILYERHKFSKHTGRIHDSEYPDISSRKLGGYVGGPQEYKRLVKAIQLDKEAALKSTSWGAFQVLGEHHLALGFPTAEALVKYLSQSERNQLDIFVKSCHKVNPRWKQTLQNEDWEGFARYYNGSGYKKNRYDEKLKETFGRLKNNHESN